MDLEDKYKLIFGGFGRFRWILRRSGNIFGEHEISFTSDEDMIAVKHISYSRKLFAKGALNIVGWLDNINIKPGLYSMDDVFNS